MFSKTFKGGYSKRIFLNVYQRLQYGFFYIISKTLKRTFFYDFPRHFSVEIVKNFPKGFLKFFQFFLIFRKAFQDFSTTIKKKMFQRGFVWINKKGPSIWMFKNLQGRLTFLRSPKTLPQWIFFGDFVQFLTIFEINLFTIFLIWFFFLVFSSLAFPKLLNANLCEHLKIFPRTSYKSF